MKKRFPLMLILLLILMQGFAIAAAATSLPDLTRKGSLTIEMRWNGENCGMASCGFAKLPISMRIRHVLN